MIATDVSEEPTTAIFRVMAKFQIPRHHILQDCHLDTYHHEIFRFHNE